MPSMSGGCCLEMAHSGRAHGPEAPTAACAHRHVVPTAAAPNQPPVPPCHPPTSCLPVPRLPAAALNEVIYSQPYQTHDDHSFVFTMKAGLLLWFALLCFALRCFALLLLLCVALRCFASSALLLRGGAVASGRRCPWMWLLGHSSHCRAGAPRIRAVLWRLTTACARPPDLPHFRAALPCLTTSCDRPPNLTRWWTPAASRRARSTACAATCGSWCTARPPWHVRCVSQGRTHCLHAPCRAGCVWEHSKAWCAHSLPCLPQPRRPRPSLPRLPCRHIPSATSHPPHPIRHIPSARRTPAATRR